MIANSASVASPAIADDAVPTDLALRRDGVVLLDSIIDPELLARCLEEIERDYPDMAVDHPARNFTLNTGRFAMPLCLRGALAARELAFNPALLNLAECALGRAFKIDSINLLVSLPGTPDQAIHHDDLLFPETGVDRVLPCFAFGVSVPLVKLDAVSGSTAFWRGSHRVGAAQGEADFAPDVPVGSALAWDYRVFHRGIANRGTVPRLSIFILYCRSWWTELVGARNSEYEKLLIARDVHEGFGAKHKSIVSRARIVD